MPNKVINGAYLPANFFSQEDFHKNPSPGNYITLTFLLPGDGLPRRRIIVLYKFNYWQISVQEGSVLAVLDFVLILTITTDPLNIISHK